jgi:hypothetical protein
MYHGGHVLVVGMPTFSSATLERKHDIVFRTYKTFEFNHRFGNMAEFDSKQCADNEYLHE